MICLLLGGVFTLWGIVDYNGSESLTATVVSIDGGECTYSWAGPPAPAEGDSADTCPPGVTVGEEVEVFVNPDGVAWTSAESMATAILISGAVTLLLGLPLIALGAFLRSRRT